jgi:Xaa-Pro dipeptidase
MRSADLADSPAVCQWDRIARRCFLRCPNFFTQRDSTVDFVRKNIRAGKLIRGAEVDDVSRGVITRAGFGEQFTHRTGHSIGEETHGSGVNIDDFETRDSRRIIPGVCFSIEPGIYLEGKFGVRSEINVYVSDKDIEVTGQPIQTEIIPILKTR